MPLLILKADVSSVKKPMIPDNQELSKIKKLTKSLVFICQRRLVHKEEFYFGS